MTILIFLTLCLAVQGADKPLPQTVQGTIPASTATGMSNEEVARMISLSSAAAKVVREAQPLLAIGKNAEAERLLRDALAERPRLIPARSLLAEALIRQGKDAEALSLFLGLQASQGIWSEGNAVRIALLRARLGQVAASRADWSPEIVMRYCDGLPEARASLPSVATAKGLETAWSLAAGYLTDLHGDTPGAAFFYGRALSLDPANAFVNLKMGDLELRTGKAASAVSRYALAAKGAGKLKEEAVRQGATARSISAATKGTAVPSGG